MEEKKGTVATIKNIKYKDVVALKKVFDKVTIDGVSDDHIPNVLIAIGQVSEEQESYDKKVKSIDERRPDKIKEYQNNPDTKLSQEEIDYMNRLFGKWSVDKEAAIDILLDRESSVPISDIKILPKDCIISWVKANKTAIKAIESAVIYSLMLKKD